MTKRQSLFIMVPLSWALSSPASAVEVEQRALSTPSATEQPVRISSVSVANPGARVPSVTTNPAWDMFQQLESLQNTVARLQGQVEEQQQVIDKLKQDLKSRYTDLDQRLEQLNQRPLASTAVAPAAAMPPANPQTAAASDVNDPATTATVSIAAPSSPPQPAAVPIRQDVSAEEIERQKQAYLAAYQRFRSDGAGAAITAMQAFIQKYPASVFSPNAHYWLGEFNLAVEPANYAAAEQSFRRVIRDYDGSPKVPASYYKLGTIADLRSQRDEARKWMGELVARFASSPEARLAQSYLDQNPAGVANGAAKP